MTRSELTAVLAQRFPALSRADAEVSVAEILAAIGRSLGEGGRVEIRGFGSFSLRYQAARMRRNPATGEPVPTPGKCIPAFRAGKELREGVDNSVRLD